MTALSPARRRNLDVYAVIALGGAAGAAARYGLSVLVPEGGAGVWGTWVANVAGCLAIGVLMGVIDLAGTPHRLLRPFVGVGVLGGMTTFSTYAVEIGRLVTAGEAGTALLYLAGTLVTALAAVVAGLAAVQGIAGRARRGPRPASDAPAPNPGAGDDETW